MAASIIRIKRSSVVGNPSTLASGELAYSSLAETGQDTGIFTGGDRLYIGVGAETGGNAANHVVIGGKFFTDRLNQQGGILANDKAIVVDANGIIDTIKTTNIQIGGTSGAGNDNIIAATNTDGGLTLQPKGAGYVTIYGTNGMVVPVGTTAQRGPLNVGTIRFNTDLGLFEGYHGGQWQSLGGVRSVDDQTYIIAEATPGNGDGTLYFYSSGTNIATFTQTSLKILENTAASSTTTGALIVAGGAGIGQNLWVGGNIYGAAGTLSSLAVTNGATVGQNLTVTLQASAGSLVVSGQSGLQNVTAAVVTATSINVTGATTLGSLSAGATTSTSLNVTGATSVQGLTAGLTTATGLNVTGNSYLSGTTATSLNVTGSSTLGNLTAGVTTATSLVITSTVDSVSTTTGAIQVAGGVGIAKELYVGGSLTVMGGINATITGVSSTATNLQGGLPGQFAYQVASGVTGFVSTGSMYVGRAVLADTATTATNAGNASTADYATNAGNATTANSATTATNIAGGLAGQFAYQTAPGVTGFVSTGNIYVGQAVLADTATQANNATTATNVAGGLAGQLLVQTAPGKTGFTNTNNITVGYATNAVYATTSTNIAGGLTGQFAYQTAAGVTGFISTGNMYVGYATNAVNATNAANATFATSATYSTNLYGGGANQIPFQSATDTTTFSSGFKYNASTGQLSITDASSGNAAISVSGGIEATTGTFSGLVTAKAGVQINSGNNLALFNTANNGYGMDIYNGGATGKDRLSVGISGAEQFFISSTGTVGVISQLQAYTADGLTGALQVKGGASIAKDLYVGDNSYLGGIHIHDTTISAISTNTTTVVNITLAPSGTGTVSVSNSRIVSLADPQNPQDAATKYYVDHIAQGLNMHESVEAATTASLASITGGSVTYANGTNGVGATLTLGVALTKLDGYTLENGDRILIKNEPNSQYDGIYTWATGGQTLTRATDANSGTGLHGGDFTFVEYGDTNSATGWVQVNEVLTIGTDAQLWTQFSGAGTYRAGNGLSLSGTTFNVNPGYGIDIGAGNSVELAVSVAGGGLTYTAGVLDIVGTSNRITVNADSIDIASTYIGQTSITTVGTLTSGVWHGTTIDPAHGGTGYSTFSAYDLLVGTMAGGLTKLPLGTAGQVLQVSPDGTTLEYADVDGGTF